MRYVLGILLLILLSVAIWLPSPAPAPLPREPGLPFRPPVEPPGEGPERDHRRLESGDLVGMFPEHVFRRGDAAAPLVALTFDDGPDGQYTPQVLDILSEHDVPATFFITGTQAQRNLLILRRIADEGHVLANHGYAHIRYTAASPEAVRADLRRNHVLVRNVTGVSMDLFRPPYGALDSLATRIVIDEGYRIILWSIDTRDWQERTADQIVDAVLGGIHPGAIVLQHSAGGPDMDLSGTVEALPRIIRELRQRGYRFVAIPELL